MNTVTEPGTRTHFTTERHPLLLFYDGECAFCNRWVNKVKEADHAHRMRYGSKQGQTFQQVARLHPEFAKVDSVVLVKRRDDGNDEFLVRSAAVREVIAGLPRFRFFEIVLNIFPTMISDIGYRIFSKLRTPLFGKWHHCRVPIEEDKELYVK
jgi:predicted DCC family thiol-disulfide oxidoreductase YuxK